MAKKCGLFYEELAFRSLRVKLVLAEEVKDEAYVAEVVLRRLGEYQNVVDIDNYKLVTVSGKDIVHKALKRGRGVAESKGHDFELVVAKSSAKSRLMNIAWLDADLVEAGMKIKTGVDDRAKE